MSKRKYKNNLDLSSRLTKRIDFESLSVDIESGVGSIVQNYVWSKCCTTYAEIIPLSGKENFLSEQITTKLSHVITIRYLAEVKSNMRIIYDNRIFNISYIHNYEEKDQVLKIYAIENLNS